MLAARLRRLEDLELITRDRSSTRSVPGYRLTYAGRELRPVLRSLWQWSLRFIPEDPAMAERDPDIVIRWLSDRIDASALPERTVVLDLDVSGTGAKRFWLVLERGVGPSVCVEDPCLGGERYVFVVADVRALYPIARGLRDWSAAVGDGSVEVAGEPALVRALPAWFVGHRNGFVGEAVPAPTKRPPSSRRPDTLGDRATSVGTRKTAG